MTGATLLDTGSNLKTPERWASPWPFPKRRVDQSVFIRPGRKEERPGEGEVGSGLGSPSKPLPASLQCHLWCLEL